MTQTTEPQIDVQEHGANQQTLNKRLFMQLQVFGGCARAEELVQALRPSGIEGVLYRDLGDPKGVGLLTMSEDPVFFVTRLRDLLNSDPFRQLIHKPEFTMIGRTYSSGYEPDLEDWLLNKPKRASCNPEWPWAIWYPLRRSGAFAKLTPQEQNAILREHGIIGRAYGDADLAHDIRLACHGLDAHDNDFLIGLVGRELHPLSHIVQTMRKTKQTSEFIQTLGPFFVGHALWQAANRG
ncbi:MAG TPA: chlorite dismutase family protein [Terriglobia bacterium]|nr:chlorite dismutase family protein [Terriglobia bacterium]